MWDAVLVYIEIETIITTKTCIIIIMISLMNTAVGIQYKS